MSSFQEIFWKAAIDGAITALTEIKGSKSKEINKAKTSKKKKEIIKDEV